jgi:hypothetical protein
MYSFLTCCGGLLYGPAVYSKIRQISETVCISRAPSLKNRRFKMGDFKILQNVGEL